MASEAASSSTSNEAMVEVVLRSPDPAKLKDLTLTVPLRWRVQDLKWLISAEHPQRPSPSQQVLIYCGKVLSDGDAPLAKILRRPEPEGRYTLHLAIRSEEPLTQSASAPNLGDIRATSSAVPTSASPVVALPVVMVNPIVSAAYNAAVAAVYADPGRDRGTSPAQQNPNQPMVPAIAFFPLGIPVLVPAQAAQNPGFQIGQAAPVQTQIRPPQHNQPRNVQRIRPFQQPGNKTESVRL